MFFKICLFSFSLLCQLLAAGYALHLFLRARAYRLACGFLALGLTLMIGRRAVPLYQILNGGDVSILDAWLAAPISLLLLLGMLQFRSLLIELEHKNFVLDQCSKTDSLTYAISRLETFSRAQVEIERSFRTKKELAFLMLDIDHFKDVNDRYGHPIGDAVLVNLVKSCQDELRAIDILGRVGGEEFLVVLPETNQTQALEVGERLRKCVQDKVFVETFNQQVRITISVGIAVFDPGACKTATVSEVLKKCYQGCDQAMYRAKNKGRNQVSI